MKHFEGNYVGPENTTFFLQGWTPEGPKAVAALVHGHGEHSGRFAHVGKAFAEAGYALVAFDLRGNGRSGGQRGHSASYKTLMDDIAVFLEQVAERYPDLPLVLYGHSMGGNLVLNYCLRRKPRVRAVVVTSPWLRLAFEPPAFQIALGRVMNRIWPTFSLSSGFDNDSLSRDPSVGENYSADPLVHSRISARHFFVIRSSGLWALEHASEFTLPLLLMHGTGDRVTSQAASLQFAERAGKLVTYRAWEDCYHELHNEPEKTEVLRTIIRWMDREVS